LEGTEVNQKIQPSDTVTFSVKEKRYMFELLQIGYAWRCVDPYLIFGLAQHRTKLQYAVAYQNTSNGFSKGYTAPVFGVGLNVVLSHIFYFRCNGNAIWDLKNNGILWET
jgi:hypothetical protein